MTRPWIWPSALPSAGCLLRLRECFEERMQLCGDQCGSLLSVRAGDSTGVGDDSHHPVIGDLQACRSPMLAFSRVSRTGEQFISGFAGEPLIVMSQT